MAHSHLQSKIRSVILCLLSFVLSVCLFLVTVCTVLMMTVFNQGYIYDNMNSSNYFIDKSDEIVVSLTDLGYASGLDEGFFDNLIDEVMVNRDTLEYLETYYSLKDSNADTTNFEQQLNEAITAYAEANNIKNVDKDGRSVLIKEAAKIYENSIEIPYFGRSFPYFKAAKQALPFVIVGLVVLSAVICAVFFKVNHWKHRVVKFICYATSGACLSVLVIPVYLLITGVINHINLSSRALYNMVIELSNGFEMSMIFASLLLLIMSIALYIKYYMMRRKHR